MRVASITTHWVASPSFCKRQYKEKGVKKSSVSNLNSDPRAVLGRNLVFKGNLKPQIAKEDLIRILKDALEEDKKSKNPIVKSVNKNFIEEFAERITKNPDKNILIGLSGESASGKSEITNAIRRFAEKLNLRIETISADNYFKDISALIAKFGSFDGVIESGYDVDSPDNFDLVQLYEDLKALSKGNDVKIPKYLINGTGISVPNAIPKKAQKIILIEGLATLYEPVRSLLDLEIFVDIDPKIQEERYIKRAMATRNQTKEFALAQLDYVREAAKKYLHPKKWASDIVIDGATEIKRYAKLIASLKENILKHIF